METASGNLQRLIATLACHAIDKPVFLRDPARPETFHVTDEWLRLTDAYKGGARGFPDQFVDSHQDLMVVFLPKKIFGPGL
jgi:hypothetical protein